MLQIAQAEMLMIDDDIFKHFTQLLSSMYTLFTLSLSHYSLSLSHYSLSHSFFFSLLIFFLTDKRMRVGFSNSSGFQFQGMFIFFEFGVIEEKEKE
jgi:hypothetical protein